MTRESTQAVFLCLKRRKGREKQGKSQGVWVTDYEWRMRNMIHDTRLVTETREITRYFPGWRRKRRVLSSILLFQETKKRGRPTRLNRLFCVSYSFSFLPLRESQSILSLSPLIWFMALNMIMMQRPSLFSSLSLCFDLLSLFLLLFLTISFADKLIHSSSFLCL